MLGLSASRQGLFMLWRASIAGEQMGAGQATKLAHG